MEEKKVISIEDRIPRLKEARKKKANRRLVFYLSIFFFLISIIVYLQSPLSYIKKIEVDGNEFISDTEIIDTSQIELNTNIWMVNLAKTERTLEALSLIKEAEVERKLPWTMKVNVKEHHVIGYRKVKNGFHPVLENGMIVETDNAVQIEGPILVNFKDNEYLERMALELGEVPEQIFQLISEISWEPTERNKYKILLYMNDGFIVETSIRNFAEKITAYPSIVSQLDRDETGIIHMGVGTYFERID